MTRILNSAQRNLLEELADVACEHTGNLARDRNVAPSTCRRRLDALEDAGLVVGILHDERDMLEGGRRRIYWSITDAGLEAL